MKRLFFFFLLFLLMSSFAHANEPDRKELLGSPQVVEDAAEPKFVELSPENLKKQLKVVSIRSFAVFGFNSSGVAVHFPSYDNNIYTFTTFSPARLLDAKGNDVKYERERGIYDHDSHSDELRFLPLEGKKPVIFERAEGSITLRYPIKMRTVVVKPGGKAPEGLTVNIDGPFVTWSDPKKILPEAAPFMPVAQLRAIDASGRRLKQHDYRGFSMRAGVSTEKYAYWGDVREVRIDLVDEWAVLEIAYALPSIKPLPASQAGTPPKEGPVKDTPGGKVKIQVVAQPKPQAEAGPIKKSAKPGKTSAVPGKMSKDEALTQLKKLGFRRFDANSFILAATRGKADALKLFLAGGMPVDAESGGRTALMMAATMGKVEAGKVLIKAGADVNQTDSSGTPPLLRAVMQCKAADLVQVLIDAGADLTVSYPGGVSAVGMAQVTNCTEIIKVLQAAGAK